MPTWPTARDGFGLGFTSRSGGKCCQYPERVSTSSGIIATSGSSIRIEKPNQGLKYCSWINSETSLSMWGCGTFFCQVMCCLAFFWALLWFMNLSFDSRLHSVYHYDKELFRKKFLGKPGVPWLDLSIFLSCATCPPGNWSLLGVSTRFSVVSRASSVE